MSEIREMLEKIKDPNNICYAMYASDSYTLMKAFRRDPIVSRLIELGPEVVPFVERQFKENTDKLDKITLSAYAYVLQSVDLESAVRVLAPFFAQAVENPDPFFVYFIAHALRQNLKLRVAPIDPHYTRGELLETLEIIRKPKRRLNQK